jgi:hypothetical protein
MSSPREILLTSVEDALKRIKIADGYLTNAGMAVTREPAPVVADDAAEFIAVVWNRQDRATDPALMRTHRLTTFSVLAKLPATLTQAQSRLDDLATDIETAMADQQFRYQVGFEFPKYQSAEPLVPKQITDGWIGISITYTSHIPIRR